MTKHCITCKREIASGQQECYICGSSQSYVRYYLKGVIVFLVSLIIAVWFGYQYFENAAKQLQANHAVLTQNKTKDASDRVKQLELLLEQANQKLQQAQVNSTQNSENAVEDKLKFDETEKRAKKAEERASWLSKENRRFKAKVKELTELLAEAKNVAKESSPLPSTVNPQLTTLKQELAGYESQKQALMSNIDTKKKQVEASWLLATGNDSVPPNVETTTQRVQQIEQATANETSQLLLLDGQIEGVKKKILDIEGG